MGAASYKALNIENQAALKARLERELKSNTYNAESGTITVSAIQTNAIAKLNDYYRNLFMDSPEFDQQRSNYAIPKNAIKDPERMRKMNAFFFWASWACVTERPNSDISYTHNWPPDELVGNKATGDLMLWTGFSIIMLLFGIGILVFYHAKTKEEGNFELPVVDPLMRQNITPSMRAVEKIFLGSKFTYIGSGCYGYSNCSLWR